MLRRFAVAVVIIAIALIPSVGFRLLGRCQRRPSPGFLGSGAYLSCFFRTLFVSALLRLSLGISRLFSSSLRFRPIRTFPVGSSLILLPGFGSSFCRYLLGGGLIRCEFVCLCLVGCDLFCGRLVGSNLVQGRLSTP